MMIDVVEVIGESHIITVHGLKHVMAVVRDRKLDTLKIMGCQWEHILWVIDVVERDTIVTHERLGATQAADASQQRE